MKAFDVTLRGYDGSTSDTDHLVKWVKAESLEVLLDWLERVGLEDKLDGPPREMPEYADLEFEDGIDVIVYSGREDWNGESQLERWKREVSAFV